ncbi:uncharacterized protein LOC143040617 [Oratosquilla oratoria]|uniref:uncharacterized protein LOC143040617 n=1 Tax=Oratosquilla oratoria TaxID=337810 RepID=UPI003F758CA3
MDKNRFDNMLKTLKDLGYNWQEIKNDKNVLFLLEFRVKEKHKLLTEFGINSPRLHEVIYAQALMKSEVGFLKEYGIFKENFDVLCHLFGAISELDLAPHIKEGCKEKFSHHESASLGEIYTYILQQYLAFRFQCSSEEFTALQSSTVPQWKSLVKYKGICDVLIDTMKKDYKDIVKTPCLLDLDPENTYNFINRCPEIGGTRFLDIISDIPQLLFLPFDQAMKWSDLLKKYKVQKFSFTPEVLRLFKGFNLKIVEEKLKVLKNLQEWEVIKSSEQLFFILRRDDGVKRILDNLHSGTPVLSLHAARQMSPPSFQVNNSTTPNFMQTKRFSNEIVSYISNELDLEEEEVHDLLTSVAKSHLGLLNTKTIIELLFNFGFTREQIISGIQLISFEYRLVFEELQQFPFRPEAQPFDEWMDNPCILDLVSYFIKKNSPRLSHNYLD